MFFLKYNPLGTCKRQKRGELVNIAQYAEREEIEPYQEGAREKRRVSFSASIPFSFIIPGHDYMFKLSERTKDSEPKYPEQFWGEIIAYRLGCLTGVPVPPAFAAYHEKMDMAGALIEWFYGYPGEAREEYTPGGDLFQKRIPDYERKRGELHNMQDLIAIALEYAGKGLAHNWLEHWSKVLLFDVLIGNTDRHQDNWGIIKTAINAHPHYYFCPAFDNGTALGHEIVSGNFVNIISRLRSKDPLQSYALNPGKAKHHLKWSREEPTQMPHFLMITKLIEAYPDTKGYMRGCVDFPIEDLRKEVLELVEISNDMPIKDGILSRERADFIMELIAYRQQLARELLES